MVNNKKGINTGHHSSWFLPLNITDWILQWLQYQTYLWLVSEYLTILPWHLEPCLLGYCYNTFIKVQTDLVQRLLAADEASDPYWIFVLDSRLTLTEIFRLNGFTVDRFSGWMELKLTAYRGIDFTRENPQSDIPIQVTRRLIVCWSSVLLEPNNSWINGPKFNVTLP